MCRMMLSHSYRPAPGEDGDVAYLSVREVAGRLGVHVQTVYAWIGRGELRALNLSSGSQRPRWRVDERELERFIRSLETGPEEQS